MGKEEKNSERVSAIELFGGKGKEAEKEEEGEEYDDKIEEEEEK